MKNAISAGHETTLQVAKEILLAGGNAFDAAIAAHAAMFITEPCMASAGGAGFALTKTQKGDLKFFDFFVQTPVSKIKENIEFTAIDVNFGDDTETFHVGLGSVAVPGTIAGLFAIHKAYGTMPLTEVFSQAIELAKVGIKLNAFQAYDLELLAHIFKIDPRGKEIFFDGDFPKTEGQIIQMSGLADFLDVLAREGQDLFYKGEIGKLISEASNSRGGFIQQDDLASYKVNIGKPFSFPFNGYQIHTPNGPSKGGAALALMLCELTEDEAAIPMAIKKAQQVLQQAASIPKQLSKKLKTHNYSLSPGLASNKGTSHFNIVDSQNNAISLTSTIGEGSGYFVPGTDIQLNNMLGEIFLLPQGAHSWTTNSRMHSMMTPTLVTNKMGKLNIIAGSGGASRIPYAIGQVIHQLLVKGLALPEAIQAGRYHFQEGNFQLEKGTSWIPKNDAFNSWNQPSLYFGGVHTIQIENGGYFAHGDERRYGVAEVF